MHHLVIIAIMGLTLGIIFESNDGNLKLSLSNENKEIMIDYKSTHNPNHSGQFRNKFCNGNKCNIPFNNPVKGMPLDSLQQSDMKGVYLSVINFRYPSPNGYGLVIMRFNDNGLALEKDTIPFDFNNKECLNNATELSNIAREISENNITNVYFNLVKYVGNRRGDFCL
jgi:hypothetical protein